MKQTRREFMKNVGSGGMMAFMIALVATPLGVLGTFHPPKPKPKPKPPRKKEFDLLDGIMKENFEGKYSIMGNPMHKDDRIGELWANQLPGHTHENYPGEYFPVNNNNKTMFTAEDMHRAGKAAVEHYLKNKPYRTVQPWIKGII